jgi:hypothetical protein
MAQSGDVRDVGAPGVSRRAAAAAAVAALRRDAGAAAALAPRKGEPLHRSQTPWPRGMTARPEAASGRRGRAYDDDGGGRAGDGPGSLPGRSGLMGTAVGGAFYFSSCADGAGQLDAGWGSYYLF